MGYNIHDMNNAVKNINDSLERRSQERGEQLAKQASGWGFFKFIKFLLVLGFALLLVGYPVGFIAKVFGVPEGVGLWLGLGAAGLIAVKIVK